MLRLKNVNLLYLAIGWLILTPVASFADEVTVNLDPQTPFVDFVVNVDTTTAYAIHTNTGPRTEVVDSQTVVRAGWVDSWVTLYRGVASDSGTVIAHDDDSNHNAENNFLASKLMGTLQADTYTIRATSFNYMSNGSTPTGNYTLISNLINLPETNTATVDTGTVNTGPIDTGTVESNNQTTPDTSTATPPNTTEPSSPVPSQPQETVVTPVIPPQPTPNPQPIIVIDTSPMPEPTIEQPESPVIEQTSEELQEPVSVDEPSIPDNTEPLIQELEPENLSEEPIDTPLVEQEPISEIEENQEPITAEEVETIVETLNEDGILTEIEVEIIVEALLEQAQGGPITAETIVEAGITYEDLPAQTPVQVREDDNGNAVVITAEVAAALLVLDNPVELLSTIFSDPAQAILALSSIGADMSDEERSESEKTIVAAVIVGGIAVQSATSAALAGSVSYRRRL